MQELAAGANDNLPPVNQEVVYQEAAAKIAFQEIEQHGQTRQAPHLEKLQQVID